MSFVDALRYRLRVWTHPREHERELQEELEFHLGLERMQQEHAAHGVLSGEDAGLVARRQLGNLTYALLSARFDRGPLARDADPRAHAGILEALERRDAESACERMRAHLEGVRDAVVAVHGAQRSA